MALVRNFQAETFKPNEISLNWDLPLKFNEQNEEIIVTKTDTHFPVELYNDDPSHCSIATDPRPIEIFKGKTIVQSNPSGVSVVDSTLTDTNANFSSVFLKGRLLRDRTSKVFRIIDNTNNSLTVEGDDSPTAGKYVILASFPCVSTSQLNFEFDARTKAGPGFIEDLVTIRAGAAVLIEFEEDELADLIFKDANDERFVIKSNTTNTINLFERLSFTNSGLVPFTYNSGDGYVTFNTTVDLSAVTTNHTFLDSIGVSFPILSVDDNNDRINIGTGLTVDTTSPTNEEQGAVAVIPKIGVGMSVLPSFFDSIPLPYIDNYKNSTEANSRLGTGLLDNQFYYYTAFNKPVLGGVAEAEFSTINSRTSTQSAAISMADKDFGEFLFGDMWSRFHQQLDETGDLEDLMNVFGFQFNEIHSLIDTYKLQNPDKVNYTALQPLSEQFGLPTVGFSIGADTLRRIAREMISCWKLKGTKEGIALFIRKLTTWDITNGNADFGSAIEDFLPNVSALRFFDPNLGSLNTRLTETFPLVTAGGRFARSLPGIVIPGFFTFREFVINIPNVALHVGVSEGYGVSNGTTTMTDTSVNFGANDSLVGNFLIPNTEELNDIFEIVSNTQNTITVRGVVNNRNPGGNYAVLSPLNTNRFIILNRLLPLYIPFGTRAGFRFVCDL